MLEQASGGLISSITSFVCVVFFANIATKQPIVRSGM